MKLFWNQKLLVKFLKFSYEVIGSHWVSGMSWQKVILSEKINLRRKFSLLIDKSTDMSGHA
jgi:hypothetical protein